MSAGLSIITIQVPCFTAPCASSLGCESMPTAIPLLSSRNSHSMNSLDTTTEIAVFNLNHPQVRFLPLP